MSDVALQDEPESQTKTEDLHPDIKVSEFQLSECSSHVFFCSLQADVDLLGPITSAVLESVVFPGLLLPPTTTTTVKQIRVFSSPGYLADTWTALWKDPSNVVKWQNRTRPSMTLFWCLCVDGLVGILISLAPYSCSTTVLHRLKSFFGPESFPPEETRSLSALSAISEEKGTWNKMFKWNPMFKRNERIHLKTNANPRKRKALGAISCSGGCLIVFCPFLDKRSTLGLCFLPREIQHPTQRPFGKRMPYTIVRRCSISGFRGKHRHSIGWPGSCFW